MIILIRSAVCHDESTVLLRAFVTEQILGRVSGSRRPRRIGAAGEPGR